eukprot:222674_1
MTSELLAFGWVRENIELLVPTPIIEIIHEFYKLYEKWDICGGSTNINGDIIEFPHNMWQCAFGEIQVSKGKHEWKIQVVEKSYQLSLLFGICTATYYKNEHYHNRANVSTKEYYFNYSCGCENDVGKIFSAQTKILDEKFEKITFENGDIIKISLDLDLEKGVLSFTKNESENKIGLITDVISNLDKYGDSKYRLSISNYWKGTKLKLISYLQN